MLSHPDLAKRLGAVIVRIKLKNNREFSKRVDVAKGNPENPLSQEEIIEKYQGCAEPVIGQDKVDRSIHLIMNLDKIADMNRLMDLFSKEKRARRKTRRRA